MSESNRSPWPPSPSRAVRVVQVLVFVTLAASVIYTLTRWSGAPEVINDPTVRVRSDYELMLIQCLGGLVVMFLPSFVHRRFAIDIPGFMQIAYFVFLYAAIYLGEVRSLYYRIPNWDTLLHFFSGAMLGAVGFQLVRILNDAKRDWLSLSHGFVAFFAFCFAVTCGAVWEIYEFSIDALFGTNMQKVITDTGEALVGHAAVGDTMTDLIIDTAAAGLVAIAGYLSLRRHAPTAADDSHAGGTITGPAVDDTAQATR